MAAVRQVMSMASTHMSTALISQRMAAGASGPAWLASRVLWRIFRRVLPAEDGEPN